MKEHIDNIHHSHGQKQGYPHLTSLIFLNDDYEGGDFGFWGNNLKVKLKKHLEFKTYNFSTFINFLYGFVLDVKLPTIFD